MKRFSRLSMLWTSVVLVLMLAVPWAVWADLPAPDGDGAVPIPFNGNPLQLGNVCANSTITDTALIAIRRQGGNNVAFANGSTVTISVAAVTGTGLTANIGTPNTIGLPADWVAQSSNTVSVGYVTSNVQLVAGSAGSFAGTITYRASGTNANGQPITRDTDMAVTATIINCAPPDATPPVISYVLTPSSPDGNNGWYVSDVTVDWTVSDPESDVTIDSGCVDTTINYDTTGVTLVCQAHSAGGSSSASVTIKRDATAPTINTSVDPARPGSGWWNIASGAPTVSFDCSDATSGIASCPGDYTFGEGENQSHSGTAYDNAGNSASAGVSDIDVDLTAPTLTWSNGPQNGGSYYFWFVPACPTCTANDTLSGPGACDVTGYGTTVGSHTMTATAYDVAGNSTVETRTYTVLAWTLYGFYQPVNMGALNTVKGGSTVPLKFEVFAGETELTDVAVVKSFTAKPYACNGGQLEDPVEFTTTGGTSLRYDWTDGQFIQNWKTPKDPGKCYEVTMTTQDGSYISANFKLK